MLAEFTVQLHTLAATRHDAPPRRFSKPYRSPMDDIEGVVYRLALRSEVPEDAWRTRLQWIAAFVGVPGLDDGFIHCSTAEQERVRDGMRI